MADKQQSLMIRDRFPIKNLSHQWLSSRGAASWMVHDGRDVGGNQLGGFMSNQNTNVDTGGATRDPEKIRQDVYNRNRIGDMREELKRRIDTAFDYTANTKHGEFSMLQSQAQTGDGEPVLRVGENRFPINDYCHRQIAEKVNIPFKYYERMLNETPDLLADNVNRWFDLHPKDVMVRTLDHRARALLSDKFRRLDNVDLMTAIDPTLEKTGAKIQSAALTERRLYIKAVYPNLTSDVGEVAVPGYPSRKTPDRITAGIIISNSEVGSGTLRIEGFIWRLICTNGLVRATSLKQIHVGKSTGNGDGDIGQYLTDATKEQDDKAFWMKVRDVVAASADPKWFHRDVSDIIDATQNTVNPGQIENVTKNVGDRLKLNDDETEGARHYFITNADVSQWGLTNAITRMAQDVKSYDRQVELERAASDIVQLSRNDFRELANG